MQGKNTGRLKKRVVSPRWLKDFLLAPLRVFSGNPVLSAKEYIQIAVFLAIVLPVLITTTLSYIRIKGDLTEYTFSRRQTIGRLAAIAFKEKLDRLKELGTSLATRANFRELINEGKWDNAIAIMGDVPEKFPMIDRVFVADLNGILRADTPALPDTKGASLAHRDWYQGVSRNWKPYISGVYKRIAEPRCNVLAVAIPVESDSKKIIAIVVFQVKLDRLFEWVKTIEVGPSGYVYLVDRNGNLVGHPYLSPQNEIVNYSVFPAVQKALQGKRGIEIGFDPVEKEERISAYEPVTGYDWGVIAQQPTVEALAPQASYLKVLFLTFSVIFTICCALAYFVVRAIARSHQLIREQAARFEAEKGIQLRDDFISVASHELRTPLTALRMQLEMVPKLLHDVVFRRKESSIDLFQNSLRQLDQFSKLVDGLLDVSRISAGCMTLNLEELDLSEVVLRVTKDYKAELKRAGCSVGQQLAPSVRGQWDPVRVEQVIVNLLTNAMKYGAGKPIEILTQEEGGSAKLIVRDYGIGIAKEDQKKIFERFGRVAPITKFGGLGLGLFITHQIVEAHGGTIQVESEILQGSTFNVELPLRQ